MCKEKREREEGNERLEKRRSRDQEKMKMKDKMKEKRRERREVMILLKNVSNQKNLPDELSHNDLKKSPSVFFIFS